MPRFDGKSRAEQKAEEKEIILIGLEDFDKIRKTNTINISVGFEAEAFFQKEMIPILNRVDIEIE